MKNVEHLRPMRLTCGTYSNGEDFSIFDSWKTSHHNLKLPWTGTTTFYGRQCNNVDAHIDRLYNLQSAALDVNMPQSKYVRFDQSRNSYETVTPYSEIYDSHPHRLLATSTGWKRNPDRADFFTGKRSAVMQARRKETSRKLKSSRAHSTRISHSTN